MPIMHSDCKLPNWYKSPYQSKMLIMLTQGSVIKGDTVDCLEAALHFTALREKALCSSWIPPTFL